MTSKNNKKKTRKALGKNTKTKERAFEDLEQLALQSVSGGGLGDLIKGAVKAAKGGATKAAHSGDIRDLMTPAFPQWGAAIGYALARKREGK